MSFPANPFASTLWIDSPDAAADIERLRHAQKLSVDDADLLLRFRKDGYIRLQLDAHSEPIDELVADFDRFWRERPNELLVASGKPYLRRMSAADEAEDRRPGYRIHEPHSHSSAARRLYLHPRLHEVARLILGEAPVAIQSILFEYGSAQALHRDPVFVQTEEAGHLIAAWIALEDVSSDAGPLLYVPGSHTLPPYEFAPGVYRYDPKLFGEAQMAAERAWLDAQVKERSLAPTIFTAKKGEVLFWHAALYHGGAAIKDVTHKRRSFVVHYSTCRTHHTTAATVLEPDDSVRVFGTHRQIQDGRAVGFASPVATKQRDLWPTLRNRIAALSSRV